MTLLDHIGELRLRLFRAVIALLLGTGVGLAGARPAIGLLIRPVEGHVTVLSPTEAPAIYFKVAFVLGFGVALPYIAYQIYAFVRPGLYPQERRYVLLGIPAMVVLFGLGVLFAMTVLVPFSLPVLMGFLADEVTHIYSLQEYLSFVTTLLLWMGLLFQTPLVLYLLARLGVVQPQKLKQLRKIVIFLAFLVAAIITPTTDMLTMLLVTGPFIVLYEIGILLAGLGMRQKTKARAERDLEKEIV
jgi:sec-independent protein translocase protein TatC